MLGHSCPCRGSQGWGEETCGAGGWLGPALKPIWPPALMPHMVGDTPIPQGLSPPVMHPAWHGLGGSLAVWGKARQSCHGGELGSGGQYWGWVSSLGSMDDGARLTLSPGLCEISGKS